MKKIQQMQEGEYYLIESRASANSVYFESDDLAKIFFRYCDYYLKDYIHVEEYVLNADGWAMLIKVKSAKTIRKHYGVVDINESLQDEERKSAVVEIWRILSERVRLFISTYVRMSNKMLGREGSLVRRNYGRYQFDNLEEAQDYVARIRNDQHEMKQREEKYRGYAEHFRMRGTILTNPMRSSLWVELCTVKERIEEKLVEFFGEEMPVFKGLGDLVVQKSSLNKNNIYPPPKTPPTP